MKTLRDLIEEGRHSLASSESATLDTMILLEKVSGIGRATLLAEQREDATTYLDESQEDRFRSFISKRASGVPIAYIIGEKEFYGRCFSVGPGVLIPRPDSECLVERVVEIVKKSPDSTRIVDCCSGTGCIGISVALEFARFSQSTIETPVIYLTLSDIDDGALEWTKKNATALLNHIEAVHWEVVPSDLLTRITQDSNHDSPQRPIDVIVANPPYLTTAEANAPETTIWTEPGIALDGGCSGLEVYYELVPQAFSILSIGGYLVVEHGAEQGPAVRDLFIAHGFDLVATGRDLAGNERYTEGQKTE